MKKTKISLLLIATLAFSAFPITLFSFAGAKPVAVLPDYAPMEFNTEGKSIEFNTEIKGEAGLKTSGLKTSSAGIGEWALWLWYDDVTGLYGAWYQLMAQGETCEVWVMIDDLDFPDPTDPRNPVIVTQEQCEYIADEFDNTIYPIDTEYFGDENFHDGSLAPYGTIDEEGRTAILISNIGDESYYDYTEPSYIAGFYWGSVFEYYCDRNVISIDAYDWEHRLGTEVNDWFINDDKARPNLYESVVAHEFQHLIHDDHFVLSETWMNEACSLFAEPLCGYELDLGQVEWFLETPDNSLTVWGDQPRNILADYGASFLWALYLTDHYGIDFMGRYVEQGIAGIEGINLLLPNNVDFHDVFHDWRIANLIDADCGKYGYQLDELQALYNPGAELDLSEVYELHVYEVPGEEVEWTSATAAFGETITHSSTFYPEGRGTGTYSVGPFGTEYISFPDFEGIGFLRFDGDQEAIYGWTYDYDYGEWYSGSNNLLDALLVTAPYTVETGDLLTLNTYWDIEDYWDYGFVQVSTDGGNTWTSLHNELYTTYDYDEGIHPNIYANLPGLTGWSGAYIDINFDLSDYVGDEVIFGFRYMTDWAELYEGWYIYSVAIDGVSVDTSLTESLTPVYPKPEFQVTVVQKTMWRGREHYYIRDMHIRASDNKGLKLIFAHRGTVEVTLIISPVQLNGFTDYQFKSQQISFPRRLKLKNMI